MIKRMTTKPIVHLTSVSFNIYAHNRPGARIAWLGGQKEILGGHEKSILCEFERGTGPQEIYPCLDQRNKVWCENSKGFSGRKQVISKKKKKKRPSLKFQGIFQVAFPTKSRWPPRKKKGLRWNFKGFSGRNRDFKSTKNTNLGLDLRSKAPNLLISSGHSPRLGGHNSCLGGHKQSVGGGTAPACPPVAPGLIDNNVNVDDQGPEHSQFKFLSINLDVLYNSGEIQGFYPKNYNF